MPKRYKKCPCGAEFGYLQTANTANVGFMEKLSGWTAIMTRNGNIIWVCPECAAKLKALADEIMVIVGNDLLYFPSLLRIPGGQS